MNSKLIGYCFRGTRYSFERHCMINDSVGAVMTNLCCKHLSSSILAIPAELIDRVAGALIVCQEVEVLGVSRRLEEPCRCPEELILLEFSPINQ